MSGHQYIEKDVTKHATYVAIRTTNVIFQNVFISVSAKLGAHGSQLTANTKPPAGSFSRPAALAQDLRLATQDSLCLNDSRRNEEDQFLVLCVDDVVLEQVAQHRDAAQQRNLRDVDRVLRLDDAADHHRAAVGHQYLRGRLLRDQFGVALNLLTEVRRGVLHVDVQEDRVFRSDLRSYRQPQESINVSHGRRTTQLRLRHDRHAHTLFHQGLDVVLGNDTRTRKHFQQAARFSQRKHRIDAHGVAGVEERQTAGRRRRAQ